MTKSIEKLRAHIKKYSYYETMAALLSWDQHTYMPVKSTENRAEVAAEITELALTLLLSEETGDLIESAEQETLEEQDRDFLTIVKREYRDKKKVPQDLQVRMAKESTRAYEAWKQAKINNNFNEFEPMLKIITDLQREEAQCRGYETEPYDALLDKFERDMKAAEVDDIIEKLKPRLLELVSELEKGKKPRRLETGETFPIHKQQELNKEILKLMGFDFDAGNLSLSPHPFTASIAPQDVRVTTRYRENDPIYTIFPTIHEGGHALYELGVPPEKQVFIENLAASFGIHESQSRFWENMVGRSLEFWKFFFPTLTAIFPVFKNVNYETLWRSVNIVEPSLIRTSADELTYNFHIMLRFELERGMINGDIETSDLPGLWNEKMKSYLDIQPPNHSDGVLQDMHWAVGLYGYFPTYMLGNLYAAQLYNKMKQDIGDIDASILSGRFEELLQWMRREVHVHGSLYGPREVLEKATGEKLNIDYFMQYAGEKFRRVYDL